MKWSIAVPWVLTLATLLIGVWQFAVQQSQANKRPFLEKQLETSFKASEAVATLASTTDAEEWEAARQTFWQLYWGPLSIVENRAVEQAMIAVGKLVPTAVDPSVELPMSSLKSASYQLAHAMREMVLESWNVDLPELTQERASE